jgi:hypothetical protein
VIWLKKFVPDLRVVDCINKPLKMYCDNQPVVYYAHNKSSNASKPIQVKFYVVKDRIRDKTISLELQGQRIWLRIRSRKAYHSMCSRNT